MAFVGTPVVKQVAEGLFRITGVLLEGSGANDTGTIALDGYAGVADIVLPNTDEWQPYAPLGGTPVSLQDAVSVLINRTTNNGILVIPVDVVKTGTTHEDFLVVLHNSSDPEGTDTPELEIYIRFHLSAS
jgi:hypothetical protein